MIVEASDDEHQPPKGEEEYKEYEKYRFDGTFVDLSKNRIGRLVTVLLGIVPVYVCSYKCLHFLQNDKTSQNQ